MGKVQVVTWLQMQIGLIVASLKDEESASSSFEGDTQSPLQGFLRVPNCSEIHEI